MFERFGKLRYVGIDKRMENGVVTVVTGFIEFEDDSVSDELISKGYMEFEDNKCEVKSYEEYKRQSKRVSATVLKLDCAQGALLQPPKQDSSKHILNVLNDDCLREIFKKLHFSTLASVVSVCVRFHRVAKEAFSSKYKSKKIHIYDLAWNRRPTISQVNNFLSEFGSSISSVSLKARALGRYASYKKYEDTHLHLEMISKYCNELKELEFCSFRVPESTLYEMRTLFERLRRLCVEYIKSTSFFEIISGCSNLEVLDVYFHGDMGALIPSNSTLPKLIEATLNWKIRDEDNFDFRAMHKFLELNSKLKVLRLMRACDLVTKVSDLRELKEFDINVDGKFFPSIAATLGSPNIQIENLKVDATDLYFYGSPDPPDLYSIPTFRTITEFCMRNILNMLTLDKMIYLLQHLPNLKTFHIFYRFKNDSETLMTIKSILQHAPQLSKLVFERSNLFTKLDEPPYRSFPIDDVKYDEILKLVENRASGVKLTIQFYFHSRLHDEYVCTSQSIYILNMVPRLLTIEQRVNMKKFHYYAI